MRCDKNPKKFLWFKYFGWHDFIYKGIEEYMTSTGNYVEGKPIQKKMICDRWQCSKYGLKNTTNHRRDIFG